jgi:hypothetical protein
MKAVYMKNLVKLVGIISFMMIILFTLVSCDVDKEEEFSKKRSGTIIASKDGKVGFSFANREISNTQRYCDVTTNLPEPHNQFTLYTPPNPAEGKVFSHFVNDLEPFQVIKWEATSDAYISVSKNESKNVVETHLYISAVSMVKN